MKKRFYIITTFILAAATLTTSSCLKDPRAQDFSNVGALVELPLEAYNGVGALVSEAFPITTTAQDLPVVVNLASPKTLGSDLTVTLSVDQAALDAYNTANGLTTADGTAYSLPPSTSYSISSLKVTIPAGKHTGTLHIAVTSSNLDPSGLYILPLTITDGGGQKISNYKTLLLNLQAKNQYDMDYTATGYVFHPSAARSIDDTYRLATVGASANQAPLADLGPAANYYFNFTITPGAGNIATLTNWVPVGSTPAVPASGFMTLDNPAGVDYTASTDGATGLPPTDLPGGTKYNSTLFNNTYNSDTKTFMMHFGYAGGSTSQAGYTRQFYMKLVAQ